MSAITDLGVGSIPRWANWEYANAAARTGATGFVAADIGKIAKQTDTGTFWELTAVTPTWAQVGGGSNIQLDITINAEVTNSIQVDIQVQDSSGNDLLAIYVFDMWLSDDTAGDLTAFTPSTGFTAATGDELFEFVVDKMKKFITDSTGTLALTIEETAARTWYLCTQMPDGTVLVSDAITFV